MLYTLMLDGIPLGRVDLQSAPRSAGFLLPRPAYERSVAQNVARQLGVALRVSGSPRVQGSVGARALAAALGRSVRLQDRLSLIDAWGVHAAIVHILIVEFPRDAVPVVVAELREQAAPRGAVLPDVVVGPGQRSRPAA